MHEISCFFIFFWIGVFICNALTLLCFRIFSALYLYIFYPFLKSKVESGEGRIIGGQTYDQTRRIQYFKERGAAGCAGAQMV